MLLNDGEMVIGVFGWVYVLLGDDLVVVFDYVSVLVWVGDSGQVWMGELLL